MSNSDESTPRIAGMICAPPPPQAPVENGEDIPQPRQPASLHGLLNYALEAAKTEDSPKESRFQPMDEERKNFLEQAVQSLTVDVIEVLLKQIKILQKVETLQEGEDPTEYITALDIISDFVCDIDTANDFHKIGGFVILPPCLKCNNARIRAQTCNLLAELCQNNPYCQQVFLENAFMPTLVNIVETDQDSEAVVKALYAISCNVRENPGGVSQLIQYKGIQVFLEILKKNEEKSNIKICFLLNALCGSQPDFKNRLVFVGYIPALLFSLTGGPNPSHEHILGLLYKLIEDNPTGINEARQNKHNAKEILEKYLSQVGEKKEYATEHEYCQSILQNLFPDN